MADSPPITLPLTGRHGTGLTEPEVRRLQVILRREGCDLTLEQTWARAIELISLFRMLLGPLPEDRSRDVS